MNLEKHEDELPCDGFNCLCFEADWSGYYDYFGQACGGNLRHKGFQWCPTAKVNFLVDSKYISSEESNHENPTCT